MCSLQRTMARRRSSGPKRHRCRPEEPPQISISFPSPPPRLSRLASPQRAYPANAFQPRREPSLRPHPTHATGQALHLRLAEPPCDTRSSSSWNAASQFESARARRRRPCSSLEPKTPARHLRETLAAEGSGHPKPRELAPPGRNRPRCRFGPSMSGRRRPSTYRASSDPCPSASASSRPATERLPVRAPGPLGSSSAGESRDAAALLPSRLRPRFRPCIACWESRRAPGKAWQIAVADMWARLD
mmetsp:Transcript_115593/g.331882  ORF Transcript_115593/g.331882 Transcript_115593/m.331882 type:complete len:245 (-) Transcript_115593:569-1303(-)